MDAGKCGQSDQPSPVSRTVMTGWHQGNRAAIREWQIRRKTKRIWHVWEWGRLAFMVSRPRIGYRTPGTLAQLRTRCHRGRSGVGTAADPCCGTGHGALARRLSAVPGVSSVSHVTQSETISLGSIPPCAVFIDIHARPCPSSMKPVPGMHNGKFVLQLLQIVPSAARSSKFGVRTAGWHASGLPQDPPRCHSCVSVTVPAILKTHDWPCGLAPPAQAFTITRLRQRVSPKP